jgi:uncharacterized protein YukE
MDERLVALRESLELLAAMQRDGERRFQEQFSQHEQLFGQVALRLREVTDNIREVNDGIDSLARIAGVQQERFDGHEQKLRDLEGPRT